MGYLLFSDFISNTFMKNFNFSLKHKIALSYLILLSVIGSMTAIFLCEQKRMQEIELETLEVRKVRRNINVAHRLITELATLGETVVAWDRIDCDEYKNRQLFIDKFLIEMKKTCGNFVHPNQIDTLRGILKEKEAHLFHIRKDLYRKEKSDSLFLDRLSSVVQRMEVEKILAKDKNKSFEEVKKNVFSGYELYMLEDEILTMRRKHIYSINSYTDSLRLKNKVLNQKLSFFINYLDEQAQNVFQSREEKITKAYNQSDFLSFIVIIIAILLQFVYFFIIKSELKKEEEGKLKLQQMVCENEKLLEMRKQIILTVSHDIRGPLGNIHNCAELVSKTREKKKREGYLENIRYSCRYILHLVNDLMDAYRFNEAKEVNNIPFSLDKFLDRISSDFLRKANSKALIFKFERKDTAIVVKGDPDKIEQVLSNLLSNAIKFTPSGSIHFLSRYMEGILQVEIRDTGIGMDEETVLKMYNPFERAAQNVNSEGFGLGLFITKGLVNILKGSIEVESVFGKGTSFRITIPLLKTDEIIEVSSSEKVLSVLPNKVLVVDDDSILLKVTKDMLEHNGIICTTCLNAQEAVSALYESDYDLVLTDVQMPGTDGFGLLELFRNSDIGNSRTVPIAAMTARIDGNSGVYTQSGFCGCLHKPFEMKEMLSFLSAMLVQNGYSEFDFSRLLENAEDSRDMLLLIIKESEKDLSELEQGLEQMDRKIMRETIHRMMPAWEMLGRQDILLEFQKVLHDTDADTQSIWKACRNVADWVWKLIVESKKKMSKNENTDSRG